MELNHQLGLLEELLLAQSSSNGGGSGYPPCPCPCPWTTTTTFEELQNTSSSSITTLDQDLMNSNSSFLGLISSSTQQTNNNITTFPFSLSQQLLLPFNHHLQNLADDIPPPAGYMEEEYVLGPFLNQQQEFEGMEGMEEDLQIGPFFNDLGCKVEGEGEQISDQSVGIGENLKSKVKKVGAQPSKNLMAERRRRKRLNDRLSMLRSIVPKISKMDRTAIVGDTIDYMKELLEKIGKLREEKDAMGGSSSTFDDLIMPANQSLLRNNPKFEVERRKEDTRIELCCSGKPGMLLSTLGTLETLGLDVQQCVISCFNDFSLQASCSEVAEHRGFISPEDIKQALFRNAGYGGRCL